MKTNAKSRDKFGLSLLENGASSCLRQKELISVLEHAKLMLVS